MDIKTLAAKAVNALTVDEFYALTKAIWEREGIPPHLVGGEDDKAGVRQQNSLSSHVIETGQYEKALKLLEHPEETGIDPLYISSLGYTMAHRLMRSNYHAAKDRPEEGNLAIALLQKLYALGVAHETHTKFGDQCIHLAARRSTPELLTAYLPMVKDVNTLDTESRNALHCICTSFSFDGPHRYNWVILMAAGSDPFNCDNVGHSITYTIEHFGDDKINQYMKDHFLPMIQEANLRDSIKNEITVKLKAKV